MALTKLQTGGIAANAIVAASIAPGAVDITNIADNAITTAKIADNAITTAKIADTSGTGNVVLATSPTIITPNIGTPSFAVLTNATVDGTDSVGFRNVPVNSQSTAYVLILSDSGKTILHPAADDNARTFTIPDNANVAFTIGSAVTFINRANTLTIACTDDTLLLADSSDSGSMELTANGIATAVKIAATEWIISGVGLTAA